MEIQAKNKINEDYVADLTGANYKKKSPAVTKQLRFLKGIWREERIKWDSANDDKQLLDKVVQVAKIVTKLRGKINLIVKQVYCTEEVNLSTPIIEEPSRCIIPVHIDARQSVIAGKRANIG
jgi:hypothetical protein